MGRDFNVTRLSDEFGQYLLYLKCSACAHERQTYPNLLAHLCGWDAPLQYGGKAPEMFQMRQEALPDSCGPTAKAARNSALPLIRVARLALAVDTIERMPEFHQAPSSPRTLKP